MKKSVGNMQHMLFFSYISFPTCHSCIINLYFLHCFNIETMGDFYELFFKAKKSVAKTPHFNQNSFLLLPQNK